MSDEKKQGQDGLKDYADGWMMERKGTDAPGFLKLAIPVIAFSCAAYLVLQMHGDVNHATRGPLVKAFNAATRTSEGLMYAIAAMAFVYAGLVTAFAFRKPHED